MKATATTHVHGYCDYWTLQLYLSSLCIVDSISQAQEFQTRGEKNKFRRIFLLVTVLLTGSRLFCFPFSFFSSSPFLPLPFVSLFLSLSLSCPLSVVPQTNRCLHAVFLLPPSVSLLPPLFSLCLSFSPTQHTCKPASLGRRLCKRAPTAFLRPRKFFSVPKKIK